MTSDDIKRQTGERRELVERTDANRLRREFDSSNHQLNCSKRQTTNQVTRTAIGQQLNQRLPVANRHIGVTVSFFGEVLGQEDWCTRWSCTTCGAEPLRRTVLEFIGSQEVERELRTMGSSSAEKLLVALCEIDPNKSYDVVVHLLRWIGISIGEDRTKSALGHSSAGRLYVRMLAARDRANELRSLHTPNNDLDRIKNARALRADEKAARHEARLEAKRIRDGECRNLHGLN
jgi:hypothetical protein